MSKEEARAQTAPIEDETRRRRTEYRYGALLVLLLVTFIFVGVAPQGTWGTLVIVALESVTLVTALLASDAGRLTINVAIVVTVCAFLAAGSEVVFNSGKHMLSSTALVCALLVIVAPFAMVHGVVRRRKLDLQTVLAALCLYVMLGLFFAFVFEAIQTLNSHPFFTDGRMGTPSTFLYFSFATITTVGYGDFTASYSGGRTLSVFEAMTGQVYLVTVVALLVSNLGPAMLADRRRKGSSTTDT